MALTPSTMQLEPGDRAPDFTLPDYEGHPWSLADFADQELLLVVFMCNHCPYVVHVHEEISAIGREYPPRGVAVVGINANDFSTYAADSPEKMREYAARWDLRFPYLVDETQAVAKAYAAACTPDFFLFDRERRLIYRGQLDDSRPGNGLPVTGADLRAAMDAALAGAPVAAGQKPSIGCNIKWRAGNAPGYFAIR